MGPENLQVLGTPGMFDPTQWEIEDRTGIRSFHGRLIGVGTSQRQDHTHGSHDRHGELLMSSPRCPACRWSEIWIFECTSVATDSDVGRYCVYTLGPSLVPTETTRASIRWAGSGFEIVELATVRRGERGGPYLPAAHARALAMAAHVNEDIADAYVNRAVA